MSVVQLANVVVPAEFTDYIVENSLVSSAFFHSGVAIRNGMMASQLQAGAEFFTVPFWSDLPDIEANISNDVPTDLAQPLGITAASQVVRKAFLNGSWGEASLASELSGSSALQRIQDRVQAWWDRQFEFRLVATMLGVLYSNVANNGGDMVNDISGATGTITLNNGVTVNANAFNGQAVVDTALTIGDRLEDFKCIAVHSKIYGEMLKNNEVEFFKPSESSLVFKTYKGMLLTIDDNLTTATPGVYVTILFGPGAIGYAVAPPRTGYGTEIHRFPQQGNGGGSTILFSRLNLSLHPLGMSWSDGTGANAVVGPSPIISDLANPAHWTRAVAQRKSIPVAFLVSR